MITARSKNCCEFCGLENHSFVWSHEVIRLRKGKKIYRREWALLSHTGPMVKPKRVQVILTVAHLDNDAHNHLVKLERLRHLCQRCHLILDARYKARKRMEKLNPGNPQGEEKSATELQSICATTLKLDSNSNLDSIEDESKATHN